MVLVSWTIYHTTLLHHSTCNNHCTGVDTSFELIAVRLIAMASYDIDSPRVSHARPQYCDVIALHYSSACLLTYYRIR